MNNNFSLIISKSEIPFSHGGMNSIRFFSINLICSKLFGKLIRTNPTIESK